MAWNRPWRRRPWRLPARSSRCRSGSRVGQPNGAARWGSQVGRSSTAAGEHARKKEITTGRNKAMADEVAFMSAGELLDAFRNKRLSPVEATESALGQIERLNEQLNAFCLVDREGALAAARSSERRWQAGTPEGRLDGVPLSVKDLLLTEGWPTQRASRAIDPAGPWTEDAPSVARVREQ